ncbi:MAG: GspE/PulE family protein [Myxococcota bacterium]
MAGGIVTLLLDAGELTPQQLEYAKRVQAKLATPTPLVQVLQDLELADNARIRALIRENRQSVRIGEMLVELGYLSPSELGKALQLQAEDDGDPRLGEVLTQHGMIGEVELAQVLADHLGYPYSDPGFAEIDTELTSRVPIKWCEEHLFVPVRYEDGKVVVAFADPTKYSSLEAAQQAFGDDYVLSIATRSSIERAISRLISRPKTRDAKPANEGKIARLADELIAEAIEIGASDIHIEPMKDRLRVRMRRDGVLVPSRELPLDVAGPLTARIKVLCGADITERRRHQGGRILYESPSLAVDMRVSFYVTVHGEAVVMRLLNRPQQLLSIAEIGMAPRMLERYRAEVVEAPSGVVIITGPTGSGKTSTLYSSVNHVNTPEVSIITAEDPVEYLMDGITQCSINARIDVTFEETLRHIVRQDPDVIVIGEIRDGFSAEAAIQSALTGHKVFTTFHTEDSIGGLVRLLNMEIEAFLVSSTVVSVLAQRLLRRVCESCARDATPTPAELRRLGYGTGDLMGARFREGTGCNECHQTGYRGRVAIFELLVLDESVRDAILERKTSHEIRRISMENTGLVTLLEDGILKAARGQTSLAEVIRVLPRVTRPRPIPELRRLLGD